MSHSNKIVIKIPCISSKTITVPPNSTRIIKFELDDPNNQDAYIRDTPALELEQVNMFRKQIQCIDDYHNHNYAIRHDLYNLYWLDRYHDESMRNYLYDFCEIKNRTSYTNWIFKQFIRDLDELKDIIDNQKVLFRMKEYNQFNDFDDNIEYIQKCVNFLCNFVYESDYVRYKSTKEVEYIPLIDSIEF